MSTVCVFGSSSEAIDKRYLDAAYSLGAAICRRGEGMIFGAGKYGIMGAAARGYMSEGGVPTGVCPHFFRDRNVLLNECRLVFTDSMRERKAYMEDNSDAFVICAGGIGTFEEFFEVLTLKQLGQHSKPIVIYNLLGCYDGLLELMESSIRGKFLSEDTRKLYSVAETEEEVFELIDGYTAVEYDKYGGR
ncbi:TIGR00730 family Rossman fold protein [Lachnoclostridium sp. MSJ-17]|uniref:LOG family protein n=1 Tax=Lachnoclostridium sp. MSJ-17 TaxID=2841516 RepID=UPI001C112CAC|nr:TIGR00730 family Rossman fold protein [Lachnoclostridium sp. MSJ-17]MBU5461122.1 TIGR00730 family Rossman fold protein [Lachnoclostridium sp. MSJ-17]